ncbi:TlpA disulfide reductase family protein [Nafulsella turpanensis]|uniref:TlpA disulfide reductase family protein n=1 Tax=Nafulsella turpanensis TaxID=1265690 RepID=UPI000367B3AF|nr:TlpA disulfide reductase family protein [Nafulsella turpanensis]
MYRLIGSLILATLFMSACSSEKSAETLLEKDGVTGYWRGLIHLQEQEMPFNFEITGSGEDLRMKILNGEEILEVNELQWQGDTLLMPMHIFDTELRAVVESGSMKGIWKKNYAEDYELPFTATRDTFRFPEPAKAPIADVSGKWAVKLLGEDGNDTTKAVGIFEQNGEQLSGTFLTPTGDYRYLEGNVDGNQLQLSAFDGEHAFLFKGTIDKENKDQISGTFWSGKSWNEKWIARRDSSASLPDPNSLTHLKEGYDELAFEFPNLEGEMVSLDDSAYKDKVVIVQLFGTWCPNCMDETIFLADWYRKNKDRGVEIIGLAYEKKDDFEYARNRVQRMVDRLDVGYDFLIAGTADKEAAAKTLPMLNHVMSFPTTIFIDKEGNVRKIHTGFSGPGTGEYYTRFVEEFNLFTDKLLAE